MHAALPRSGRILGRAGAREISLGLPIDERHFFHILKRTISTPNLARLLAAAHFRRASRYMISAIARSRELSVDSSPVCTVV